MTHALTLAFLELINSGDVDEDLLLIETTVQRRYTAAAIGRSAPPSFGVPMGSYRPDGGFAVGDRVITTTVVHPKYLQQRTGVLVRFKQKRWAFKPDDPGVWQRFLQPDGTTGLTPNMFRKETP